MLHVGCYQNKDPLLQGYQSLDLEFASNRTFVVQECLETAWYIINVIPVARSTGLTHAHTAARRYYHQQP